MRPAALLLVSSNCLLRAADVRSRSSLLASSTLVSVVSRLALLAHLSSSAARARSARRRGFHLGQRGLGLGQLAAGVGQRGRGGSMLARRRRPVRRRAPAAAGPTGRCRSSAAPASRRCSASRLEQLAVFGSSRPTRCSPRGDLLVERGDLGLAAFDLGGQLGRSGSQGPQLGCAARSSRWPLPRPDDQRAVGLRPARRPG